MKVLFRIIIIIVAIACLSMIKPPSLFEIQKNIDIFVTLYKKINTDYVDEVNPALMINAGIEGMLKQLDPYTNYIPEELIEDQMTYHNEEFGSIGVKSIKINKHTYVYQVLINSPAFIAGISAGDEILSINNVDLTHKPNEEINQLFRGAIDSEIQLKIIKMQNEANKPNLVQIKRKHISYQSVSLAMMLKNKVAYIKLTEFTQNVGKNVSIAVDSLKKEGAKKIILDLRDNPGGLLGEAVNISNIFIAKDKKIVSIKGKNPTKNAVYNTLRSPSDTKIPLAILLSSSSASASEIVAGAVQDYDRGVLIGQKSFGKGLVQSVVPLSYNAKFKVTIAKYYTPSGRCIQAIDYSQPKNVNNHNVDDKKGKTLLKNVFYTQNRRKVFEEAGITPDIIIENDNKSVLFNQLKDSGIVFYFASQYAKKSTKNDIPQCVQPEWGEFSVNKKLNLSDEDYQNFVNFALKKEQVDLFDSSLDQKYQEFYSSASSTKENSEVLKASKNLKKALLEQKKQILTLYKTHFKKLIMLELVKICYGAEKKVLASFWDDKALDKAQEILSDNAKYTKILNIQ